MSHINKEHNYTVDKHSGADRQEYSYASDDDNVSVTHEDPSNLIRISSTVKDNVNLKVPCTEQQYRIFKSRLKDPLNLKHISSTVKDNVNLKVSCTEQQYRIFKPRLKDPLNLKRISCKLQDPQRLVPVCSTIQHDNSRLIGGLNSPVGGPLNVEGTCENLDPRYLFYKCSSLPEGHKSINLKKLQNVSRAQCKNTDPKLTNQNVSNVLCKRGWAVFRTERTYVKIPTDPTPMNRNVSKVPYIQRWPVYQPKRTYVKIPVDPIVMKMHNYTGVLSESRGQEVKQAVLINRVDPVDKETCSSLKEKHEMHLDIHPPAFMNQTKPLEKETDLTKTMKEVKEKNLMEEGNNTFDNETSAELVKSVTKEKEELTELNLVEEGITGNIEDTKMRPLVELVKPVKKEIEDVTHELDLLEEGITGNNVGTKMWPLLELVKTIKKEIEEVTEMDCMEQEVIPAEGGMYDLFQETAPMQSETHFVEERISPIGGEEEVLDAEVEHIDSEATETTSGKNMTEPTNSSVLKKVSSRVVTLLGNGELAILANKHLKSQTNGSFAFVRNNETALVQKANAEEMNKDLFSLK